MSRDMLKPLQNDTGHPKKRYAKNDTSLTCKTIRGSLNDFHHYHRQVILTPAHISPKIVFQQEPRYLQQAFNGVCGAFWACELGSSRVLDAVKEL